jgi:hypothetical protein
MRRKFRARDLDQGALIVVFWWLPMENGLGAKRQAA